MQYLKHGRLVLTCVGFIATGFVLVHAEKPAEKNPTSRLASDRKALEPLKVFVGEWKGVGQLRRGSTRGSWIEESVWAWKFEKRRAALVFKTPKGKYFTAGRLFPGDKTGQFRFVGALPDGKTTVSYSGSQNDRGKLVLTAEKTQQKTPKKTPKNTPKNTNGKPKDVYPDRVSIRTVAAGDRLLILYERRLGETDRYLRLAEIGYTRKGSNFGKAIVQRECVVTGGAGASQVSYKGKSYWVCCSGCRDLFNEDPEAVLAEYRARKAAEKEKN